MAAAAGGPVHAGAQAPREQTRAIDDSASPDAWKASLKLPKKDERVKTEVGFLAYSRYLLGHTMLCRMSHAPKGMNSRTIS